MYTTRVLAEYVANLRPHNVPASTRDAAMRCLFDAITSAVAGARLAKVRGLQGVACATFRSGSAAIWFDGRALDTIGAAYCNSAATSALDLDDGSRAARGHPGAGVVPAVLAEAEDRGSSLEDILVAIAAGYEVGIRVAKHRNPTNTHSWQSGRWVGLAAAAAVASLRQTEPAQLTHALAMAGVLAPNQEANGSSGYAKLTGNDVKEGIPWAVVSGLTALRLAETGHIGPEDLWDHSSHFYADAIRRDLGAQPLIEQTYFKPYSCCRYIHGVIDAFDALTREHDIAPDEIQEITVDIFGWALKLGNTTEPKNLVDIQYSIPYCLGLAAVAGTTSMVPVTEAALRRPDAVSIARKVRLRLDNEYDARFPDETLSRVAIATARGTFQSATTIPRGEPTNPMSWTELEEKNRIVCEGRLTPAQCEQLQNSLAQCRRGDIKPLLAILRTDHAVVLN